MEVLYGEATLGVADVSTLAFMDQITEDNEVCNAPHYTN